MEKELGVVSLKEIRPSELNHRKRFDEAKMKELVASVKEQGVIVPIHIRKNAAGKVPYELVCGERRYRASQEAGLKDIPAIIWTDMPDQKALEFQVLENLQREDVHPLEEAEGYEQLMKNHGFKTVDDIAAKIGKSRGYIYGRLKLCELIPENRKRFYDGKFSPSVALLVARVPEHLQKEAGRKISGDCDGCSGEAMSYRRAQEFITEEFMLRLKEAPFDTDDALLHETAGSCTLCSKRTGNQQELFPDISSADVCTDPACFKEKRVAFGNKTLAKAKESGKKVFSEVEAKKVFPKGNEGDPEGAYIRLKSVCEEDPKGRTYKQLIKVVKDAEVVFAINPNTGELEELLTKHEAARIRKVLNLVKEKDAKTSPDKSERKSELGRKEELQLAREAERNRKSVLSKVIEAISTSVRRDDKASFWKIVAEHILEGCGVDVLMNFMSSRDPEVKRDEAEKKIREHLKVISISELPVFCIELMLWTEDEWNGGSGKMVMADLLCDLYEIDKKAVMKVAKTEAKKQASSTVEVEAAEDIKAGAAVKLNSSGKAEPIKIQNQKAEPEKKPYKREIKDGKDGALEYKNEKGEKVVIKAKGKLTPEMKKAAAEAVANVTDALGLGAPKEPAKAEKKKRG